MRALIIHVCYYGSHGEHLIKDRLEWFIYQFVNCFFFAFFLRWTTNWPNFMRERAMGNETLYGDGLTCWILGHCWLKSCWKCILEQGIGKQKRSLLFILAVDGQVFLQLNQQFSYSKYSSKTWEDYSSTAVWVHGDSVVTVSRGRYLR